jgi:propanol-preferring alcohol dehydrogenase
VSVANLTREDGVTFFDMFPRSGSRPKRTAYALESANEALSDLRRGRFEGAAVLVP